MYQITDTNLIIHLQMHINRGLLSDSPVLFVASDKKDFLVNDSR